MAAFTIFLACKFPLSDLAIFCQDLGRSIGLTIQPANQPESKTILKKVENNIRQSDGVIFLFERVATSMNSGKTNFDWLSTEYGIAHSLNKVIGVIIADNLELPSAFSKDSEYVHLFDQDQREQTIRLAAYFNSIKNQIWDLTPSSLDITTPTFTRKFLKHRIWISDNGCLKYATHVGIECDKSGLSEIRHSIHMNYHTCWNKDKSECDNPPIVNIVHSDKNHKYEIIPISINNNKYSFKIAIEPPLMKNDFSEVGWESNFDQYLPTKRTELEPLRSLSNHHQHDDLVEHHYFINHPTRLLELKIVFEDGSSVGKYDAVAFIERTFSEYSIDREETSRIQSYLKFEEFQKRKELILSVDRPLLGRNYAIRWDLLS